MIVTVDSGCIFSKCSISYVLCVYRKWAYDTLRHTRWAISMHLGQNLSWGPEASCCWFSSQNRINIQNQNLKLLFELAGPQGEHWHVLFLTQWHLHTLLPNTIHLSRHFFLSLSLFSPSLLLFLLSNFTFLSCHPSVSISFLNNSICPRHTLYLSALPSISLPPLMWSSCGQLITTVQFGESKRAAPGRPEGRMKEGWGEECWAREDTGRELLEMSKKREREREETGQISDGDFPLWVLLWVQRKN